MSIKKVNSWEDVEFIVTDLESSSVVEDVSFPLAYHLSNTVNSNINADHFYKLASSEFVSDLFHDEIIESEHRVYLCSEHKQPDKFC